MEALLGNGESLNPLQMSIRAIILFFVALALIRFGGLRIIGKKSGFDLVIVIMLGAVLARGIVGASPMLSIICAAVMMIFISRTLAWISLKNPKLSQLFKGKPLILYHDGQIDWKNMAKASLSESELLSSLRLETHEQQLDNVDVATLETNGRISFILKPHRN